MNKSILRIASALLILISTSLLTLPSAQAGLYTFTSHTFTNCGATGRSGPTTANCTSAYSAASWSSNSSYFSTTNGIQYWTVPATAVYRITAYGAEGGVGNPGSNAGGLGAKAQGDISLTQGAQIKILVGQVGLAARSLDSAGSGGGGTFVTSASNTPYIIAGGGGGGGSSNSSGNKLGTPGDSGNSGTYGRDGTVAGGTSGAGGGTPSGSWSGSSGGGLTGAGGNGNTNSTVITNGGGYAFTAGGYGGVTNTTGWLYGNDGGFGGGGCSSWGAGGGGGYSGGGADYSAGSSSDREGAGGGGSFTSGSNTLSSSAINSGNGYVTIQILVGAPDAPTIGVATATSSTSATVSFTAPANSNGDTITAYTATSSPDSITGTISQSGSGTITITGLNPFTSYTFTVKAMNSYGYSVASFASNSITTSKQPTAITISLSANALSAIYRVQTTITATVVGANGIVNFTLNSKRISGCINRATTSFIATCSWKPSLHGYANLSATFTPNSSAYLTSSTSRIFPISSRPDTR